MSYDHAAKLKKPSHVRVARVAIFDLGRTRRLGAHDRWVLLTLAILCDYKTGDYPTTLTELAEDTGLTYEALRRSLDRLETEGLIQVVEPFRQRSQGRVRVLALDKLVVDAKPVHRALPPEPAQPHLQPHRRKTAEPEDSNEGTNPRPISRQSSANPAHNTRNRDIAPAPTCDDTTTPKRATEEAGKRTTDEPRDETQASAQLQRTLGGELVE